MDYKEKYEQALKRAKELLEGMDKGDYFASNGDIENIFPELKESEDERIRKEFCKAIWTYIPNDKAHEYITWLEKQGENKPTENAKTLNADNVIEWLNENVADFWANPCNPKNVINQFKKDFGL